MIETLTTTAFGVDQYADIFEKLALARQNRSALRTMCRRRLGDDIAAAPVLFIHVPKNGGTSVKRALYQSDPGHASVRYYDLFFPEWFAQMVSVAIVRDPVDRFLSGFDFLRNGGGSHVRIQARPLRRLHHVQDVDGLLDHLEPLGRSGDWLAADTFLRPQSWYVTDVDGRLRIRHLWTLDRVDAGLADFLRDLGVPSLPHANRTRRTSRQLNGEQSARIRALYAEDCALFEAVRNAGGYSGSLIGRPISALSDAMTSVSMAS